MKQKEYKLTSGDISIVLLKKTMALYLKQKLVVELTKEEGRDLMICFFDMMQATNREQEAKKVMKGVKKAKTSKHK